VIEGEHLLEVAIEHKAPVEYCAFTDEARNSSKSFQQAVDAGLPIRTIPAKLSRRISDTESPQGIFAVCSIPPPTSAYGNAILALDGVQDPGNVGTLLRTAAWFGVRTVLLGEGCADPHNPKVVRATQGAIFTLNLIERVQLQRELGELRKQGYASNATVLDDSAEELAGVAPAPKSVIVLGNEAHGIRDEVRDSCDRRVYIPRLGEGESLNVAATGAILLYHFTRPA
jgi:TrmH family RNA methyltransferase